MARAYKSGITCPIVYFVDCKEGTIIMEHISGPTAKEVIKNKMIPLRSIGEQIGKLVASAHATDLIHGDLTTSNILFRETLSEAVLIDFGLAQISSLAEDKAVDLYVLERAISSTHPEASELFPVILEAYVDNLDISTGKAILDKLAEGTTYIVSHLYIIYEFTCLFLSFVFYISFIFLYLFLPFI